MIAHFAVATAGKRLTNPSAEKTDEAWRRLIEQAQAGEHSAFDALMVRHQRQVLSTAWRLLGNSEDARDAAQETFLRVFKYLRRYQPDQDFAGWLYQIVVNVCRDMRRKRKRRELFTSLEAENEPGGVESIAGSDDLEASAIIEEQRRLIGMALETLSTKERSALVLRDLEGLSTEETARVLGSSPATVRVQICSARAKIKRFKDKLLAASGRR